MAERNGSLRYLVPVLTGLIGAGGAMAVNWYARSDIRREASAEKFSVIGERVAGIEGDLMATGVELHAYMKSHDERVASEIKRFEERIGSVEMRLIRVEESTRQSAGLAEENNCLLRRLVREN